MAKTSEKLRQLQAKVTIACCGLSALKLHKQIQCCVIHHQYQCRGAQGTLWSNELPVLKNYEFVMFANGFDFLGSSEMFAPTLSLPWLDLGASVFNRGKPLSQRSFKASYGLPPILVERVWTRLSECFPSKPFQPKHLLWCLYFLKAGETSWDSLGLSLHSNHLTVRNHIALMIMRLNQALPEVLILPPGTNSCDSLILHQDSKIGLTNVLHVWLILLLLKRAYLTFALGNTTTRISTNTGCLIL